MTVSTFIDANCSSKSGTAEGWLGKSWCRKVEEIGLFKVYGKASLQCYNGSMHKVSNQPSALPLLAPTGNPTTAAPSYLPSFLPTSVAPSIMPSRNPTLLPSKPPSTSPTAAPTTSSPSYLPSNTKTPTQYPVNMTLLQIDTYGDSGCASVVTQTETLPMDVCLPRVSGSLKLWTNRTTSLSRQSIQFTTYSDRYCSSNPQQSISLPLSMPGSVSGQQQSVCTTAIPGSTKGMKVYVVKEPSAPPPGSVIEMVYPSSASNSSCERGTGDAIMIRYLRPQQCLLGHNHQYEKLICGLDPRKYYHFNQLFRRTHRSCFNTN